MTATDVQLTMADCLQDVSVVKYVPVSWKEISRIVLTAPIMPAINYGKFIPKNRNPVSD